MSRRAAVFQTAWVVAAALGAGAHATPVFQRGGVGTVEGHVKLLATPPPNAAIRMGADPNCLRINAGHRVVQETVLRAQDGGLANVFVVVGGKFPGAPAPSGVTTIHQKGCVYQPRVQGARVGATLQIVNDDGTLHNIHSMTTKGNAFNVGQPLAGMVFKSQLKAEEVMLHVRCDVHNWMTGYIGVLSHPFYAVTNQQGMFQIREIPVGRQTIQVWHEQYGPLAKIVDVKAGGSTTADFSYTGDEKPANPSGFAIQELAIPVDAVATVSHAPTSR